MLINSGHIIISGVHEANLKSITIPFQYLHDLKGIYLNHIPLYTIAVIHFYIVYMQQGYYI